MNSDINTSALRILTLEDEPIIASRIERLCHEILGQRVKMLTLCETKAEAIKAFNDDAYDLLLLDLNLNGEDGFDILRLAAAAPSQTIVISAYKDRASEAFDFGVIDFVAKPFDKERLSLALRRFDAGSPREQHLRYISFRRAGRADIAALSDVLFFAGADKYSEVHLRDGAIKLHDKSLSQFEKILPPAFRRIHKSYIVRLSEIDRLETEKGSRYFAVLSSGERLPVGRTRFPEFSALFA